MFVRFWIGLLGMGLLCSAANADDKAAVLLKYNYPIGKTVTYKTKNTVDLDMAGMLAQMLSEWNSVERLENTGEGGVRNVEVTLKDVHESVLVSRQLIQREGFKLLEDETFRFGVKANGTLAKFVPPELERLTINEREALQAVLLNLELTYAFLFPQLPDKPVKVGDSWTAERDYRVVLDLMGLEGNSVVSSEFKVKKAKKKDGFRCFEIEEKSQITSRSYLDFGELSVISDGNGTIEGKWLFDYERGLIQEYETKASLDTQTIPLGVESAQPIESKMKAYSKRELKKIK